MAIKRIYSAGGIIVKNEKDQVKVLVTQHSGHKGWDFPKGQCEVYESAEQTAIREVEEEVGIKAEIIDKVGETQYFYYDSGEKILKTVTYFLMKYVAESQATTQFEVSDKIWLPQDQVEAKLSFKDTRQLWQKAKKKLMAYGN